MRKIVSIVSILFSLLFLNYESTAGIYVTNMTPIQLNLSFNNGLYLGISATTGTSYHTGVGTSTGEFPGGYDFSWVRVDPGLAPHTPMGAPTDVLYVGGIFSGYPSIAMSAGMYGLMTTPFRVLYNVSGADIFITFLP